GGEHEDRREQDERESEAAHAPSVRRAAARARSARRPRPASDVPPATMRAARGPLTTEHANPYAPGVDGGDISRRGLLGGFLLNATKPEIDYDSVTARVRAGWDT